MAEPGAVAALLAGVLAFFSPCVLPILPGYLVFIAGGTEATVGGRLTKTTGFVLGFVIAFALIGFLVGAAGASASFIATEAWLRRIGGAVIILFGLAMLGLVRFAWMDRDVRFHVGARASGVGAEGTRASRGHEASPITGTTNAVASTTTAGAAPLDVASGSSIGVRGSIGTVGPTGAEGFAGSEGPGGTEVASRVENSIGLSGSAARSPRQRALGLVAPMGLGAAFGVGWTPCVGPVLASILVFVGLEGGASSGALLMVLFGLGLGVPFLLFGILADRGTPLLRRFSRISTGVEVAGGIFLLALGVLVFTGTINRILLAVG